MAINRNPYSVGDKIRSKKNTYVVISVKQRPRIVIGRRIINDGGGLGNKRKFTLFKRK